MAVQSSPNFARALLTTVKVANSVAGSLACIFAVAFVNPYWWPNSSPRPSSPRWDPHLLADNVLLGVAPEAGDGTPLLPSLVPLTPNWAALLAARVVLRDDGHTCLVPVKLVCAVWSMLR